MRLLTAMAALLLSFSLFGNRIFADVIRDPGLPNLPAQVQHDVKLRTSPPSEGFLFLKPPGKVTFDLPKDQKVTLIDRKILNTLFGDSVWVKVQASDQKTNKLIEGWAYWGPATEQSQDFILLKK